MDEKKYRVMGIDPGMSGSVVVWGPYDNYLTRRTDFKSAKELVESVYELATPDVLAAVVEHVHSMRSDGRKSAWTFGLATGTAHAALNLRGVPWIEVAPVRWMNYIRKKLHWSWDEEFDSREAARTILQSSEYSSMFKFKKDHNTGDAFCMAVWLADHINKMPDSSNRTGALKRLPTLFELKQMGAERAGKQVTVV